MELGKQIKKYRRNFSLSQEDLAEKVYVSRQTISNWENDKSYPDVNSLVLLSEVFNTSIDNLIKGDVEIMKEQIREEDKRKFEKLSQVYGILFFAMIVTLIPLAKFLGYVGMIIWGVLMLITLYVAFKVEKKKKQFDIQTYGEIIAFTEGTKLDEIAKAREEGKRPYQKVLLFFGTAILTFLIAIVLNMLFN
ncbi:MAG: helix-turn-helix transcriptional regulator [Clostridiales bacterium]|nr:helix-turn-helix transcriptional regulator [Clostridiales bacterium]